MKYSQLKIGDEIYVEHSSIKAKIIYIKNSLNKTYLTLTKCGLYLKCEFQSSNNVK
jgi:hypothetical protein